VIGRAFHPTEPLRLAPRPDEAAKQRECEAAFDALEAALQETTRRYPRTMTGVDSAWPRDASYASPITYVGRTFGARVRDAIWWAIGIALVCSLIVLWFRGGPLA
jgi:preprotein translocase subunit SecF